jgi:hypothetical protein
MRPLPGTKPATCWNHRPGRLARAARAKGRVAGGQARGRQQQRAASAPALPNEIPWAALATRAEVADGLRHIALATLQGKINAREASAIVGTLKLLEPILDAEHRAELAAAAAKQRTRRLVASPGAAEDGFGWAARRLLDAVEETLQNPELSPERALESLARIAIPLGHLLQPAKLSEKLQQFEQALKALTDARPPTGDFAPLE